MEDCCIVESVKSSCDDLASGKLSSVETTSDWIKVAGHSIRPCDPRDFKRSRAYQLDQKTFERNSFHSDNKIAQEKPVAILDRSVLTPITDGDLFNDIKIVTSPNGESNDIVSEEAVVDLTIDDVLDICLSETTEMDVDKNEEESEMKEAGNGEDKKEVGKMMNDTLNDKFIETVREEEDSKKEVKEDKMEVDVCMKEQVELENGMDTSIGNDKSINSIVNTSSLQPLIKIEPFSFNLEPIDDDLSLPSSNELSNQVLSSNLKDIDNLSDLHLPSTATGRPIVSISKPTIPANTISVLSTNLSDIKSSTKNSKNMRSPRKSSTPHKIVRRSPEKLSLSKRTSVSDSETSVATSEVAKTTKQKPVVEAAKKYSTRRAIEAKSIQDKMPSKLQASHNKPAQEKTLGKDAKPSPSNHSNLQSPNQKAKSKLMPLNTKTDKQSKSPSIMSTKSPTRPSSRSPSTRRMSSSKLSPHKPTSSSYGTRSHTKTSAKATASNDNAIPIWITWKCCLCCRGSSQENLGFLYGPYKAQLEDCSSVGSKRTHEDIDDESPVEKKQDVSEMWVHEGCACWAPGVCLVGSELCGLAEAVKNAKAMDCAQCHQPGATIACSNRGCKASFHYPCAIKAGCLLLPEQLLLLCHTHNTQEKMT